MSLPHALSIGITCSIARTDHGYSASKFLAQGGT
jgi:hypothetical protein